MLGSSLSPQRLSEVGPCSQASLHPSLGGGGGGAPPVSASFSGGHQLHLLNETYGGRPSQHWLYLAEVSHVGFHKTHLHFKINS